ncbi:MAG: hypothetical protein CVU06_07210 [Bacteroidetes bacterium HGW-Bacteroidetes-22]|nr:MAG: hypothetical protein CVU06_07210 [Bacteroidetes bacterium HGW-Bacteroidetes-22]
MGDNKHLIHYLCFSFLLLILSLSELPAQQIIRVDSIILTGNHKTKSYIILREITFKTGDSLSPALLETKVAQSRENLLNIPLFNFVEAIIDNDTIAPGRTVVRFNFTERWYIWPYPIVEVADRNFNAWWRARNISRLNFGGYLLIENFRGRLERLKLLAKWGFDQKFQVEYYRPYLNKSRTIGLLLQSEFMGNHEVAASTNQDNDVNFVKDDDHWIRTYFNLYGAIVYRPVIYNSHELGLGWSLNSVEDTLTRYNQELWPNKSEQYLTIRYQFKHDKRDYRHYPLNGRYIDFSLATYLPVQASSRKIQYTETEANIRVYHPICTRWWWSGGLYGRLNSTKPASYYLMQGLGNSRNFVRGYEYYLIDGQQTFLAKTNVTFALIRPTENQLPYIKNPKFGRIHYALYLRAFVDTGITHNDLETLSSKLSNKWLIGYGLGCDLLTYYDKVLRVEYSFNQMGESGLFIHFTASI